MHFLNIHGKSAVTTRPPIKPLKSTLYENFKLPTSHGIFIAKQLLMYNFLVFSPHNFSRLYPLNNQTITGDYNDLR